ncbi:MAG: bifunctional proline dehydrogenase/L-glutamate gamma-semialdehyde dehydrogenase PutA [Rhizobiaceae bacterium]
MTTPKDTIRTNAHISEDAALQRLLDTVNIDAALRESITTRAVELVERIRADSDPGMMELFLGEYGLSSDEGVALMCLAEALLRVPDAETMDALIEDKIAPSEWGQHLGHSHSSLVNASTWALFLTGKVLREDKDNSIGSILHGAIKRLGEPVIRQAVTRVMKEMGRQFVLGETIDSAMKRAEAQEAKGFTYSYDMLGEAARTDRDARRYQLAYSNAIGRLANASHSDDIRENPGISIKLSALHPRYETLQRKRVMEELMPRARALAVLAKSAGIGLNIDAEEAGRLELSLDIIEAVLADPVLKGWNGFGVVVQAYNRRAPDVLSWLYDLAERHNRKIMVRLVKGAYWDTEIKHAQVEGHKSFPVYTRKEATDVSYICCAQKLLAMTDRIYPQFATHNAHTVAAILEMQADKSTFEFQRLHGMGEALHDTVLRRQSTRCRIYAPVGAHKDLLAYLVRRLLENGANSSFVNQIVDEDVPPREVATDPFAKVIANLTDAANPKIRQPSDLFAPERRNSKGWDLQDPGTVEHLKEGIAAFDPKIWETERGSGNTIAIRSPATGKSVGTVKFCTQTDVDQALTKAKSWGISATERADILRKTADLYEENSLEIFALLMREAGKTLLDCVGEVREAVDFLRFYSKQGESLNGEPAGLFTCISPWNFPLAIFTGQVSAALAVGNGVLAKPAETTSIIADFAVSLLHKAGVPEDVLQLLPGTGAEVGGALTSDPRIDGVCFTGSTATAQRINRSMAQNLAPCAPLIAETGGLNAMIVDSTALPEQAIGDILASAFQSAGQRCSALRVLYLQEDVSETFLQMLYGAMDELQIGNPREFATDCGPVIDEIAKRKIDAHIAAAKADNRLLKQLDIPDKGTFVGPSVIAVDSIADLGEEVFGPVLQAATFKAEELDAVIEAINATGYGLTFGLHSRIDDKVQHIINRIDAGNIYINRNQIGAVVGSQPFGGEGLSGTGPKAGGPRYLNRFLKVESAADEPASGVTIAAAEINAAFDKNDTVPHQSIKTLDLPGPTGESNRCSTYPRGRVLCLGPTAEQAREQAFRATAIGCNAIAAAPGMEVGCNGSVAPETLAKIAGLDAVIYWSADASKYRQALAKRDGPIVPMLTSGDLERWLVTERHVCIDTTAAGGNAALMGG